jgi:hypothetical protein
MTGTKMAVWYKLTDVSDVLPASIIRAMSSYNGGSKQQVDIKCN